MNTTGVLLLLLFTAAPARAGAGSDALPFLKTDTGARAAALSGVYCAAGDDALSVFYNPAGTALAGKKEILLGHNEWLEEIRSETIAYLHPLGPRLTVFGGLNLLMSGGMRRYDAGGNDTGSFSALEGSLSLGASALLTEDLYGGAAFKWLTQQAAGRKAAAWAGDAGLLKVFGGWRAGVSASNFGTGMKLGSRRFDLPLILRAGLSRTFLENYTVAAEAVQAGRTEVAGAAAAEARVLTAPKEYFFLRGGYKTGRGRYAGPGFTAGVGLATRDFRVDYAYAPYGDLGDSHRVTVGLGFGKPRPELARRGRYSDLPPRRGAVQAQPVTRPAPKKETRKKEEKKKTDGKREEVYFMW